MANYTNDNNTIRGVKNGIIKKGFHFWPVKFPLRVYEEGNVFDENGKTKIEEMAYEKKLILINERFCADIKQKFPEAFATNVPELTLKKIEKVVKPVVDKDKEISDLKEQIANLTKIVLASQAEKPKRGRKPKSESDSDDEIDSE